MDKLNVAIADDNAKMTDMLGQMIEEDKDLELVGKAHNGEEICNIIKDKEPDVVILDIIMPKMDGLSVMEKFSHNANVKKVPVFIRSWTGKDYRGCIQSWSRLLCVEAF